MKKRAVTLLLCLLLVVLSLLRGFAASAAGITPATNADFDVPGGHLDRRGLRHGAL
mgnify:CR=1 FL=1